MRGTRVPTATLAALSEPTSARCQRLPASYPFMGKEFVNMAEEYEQFLDGIKTGSIDFTACFLTPISHPAYAEAWIARALPAYSSIDATVREKLPQGAFHWDVIADGRRRRSVIGLFR